MLRALVSLGQKQRVVRPQVQAAEHGAPGVLTADGHRRRLNPGRPTRPQGQQRVGLVVGHGHGTPGQGRNPAAHPGFSSLPARPGSARNGNASVHNCALNVGARGRLPTSVARVRRWPAIAAAQAPSNPCRRRPNPWTVGSAQTLSGRPRFDLNRGVIAGRVDGGAPRGWLCGDSVRSKAAHCGDPPGVAWRVGRRYNPHRLPTTPGSAEGPRHYGPELNHVPTLGALQPSGAMLSSTTLNPTTAHRKPFYATSILHVRSIAYAASHSTQHGDLAGGNAFTLLMHDHKGSAKICMR